MLVLLSCAKTMGRIVNKNTPKGTTPLFVDNAADIITQISQFDIDELERILRVNPKIALDNYNRYQEYHSPENKSLQALLSYTGIVFKRVNPKDFTEDDLLYAQDHLLLTSFAYGLLRPLDMIKHYRLEGDVRLPEFGDITLFEYWRSKLTPLFIRLIKEQGGILINLASGEMKHLFNWKEVERSVKVITPDFKVWKNGHYKSIVIYTKMCRGEMTRLILKNRITDPELLKSFEWEGFSFNPVESDENHLTFTFSGN